MRFARKEQHLCQRDSLGQQKLSLSPFSAFCFLLSLNLLEALGQAHSWPPVRSFSCGASTFDARVSKVSEVAAQHGAHKTHSLWRPLLDSSELQWARTCFETLFIEHRELLIASCFPNEADHFFLKINAKEVELIGGIGGSRCTRRALDSLWWTVHNGR